VNEMLDRTSASRRSKWVYFLPALHLCACLTMVVGYFAPNLDYLGIVWTYLVVMDFPISLVAIGLAWKYSALAVAWVVVVDTLWWYLLSRGAEFVFRELIARRPAPQDLIPKRNE
jgi:hypothetical protein